MGGGLLFAAIGTEDKDDFGKRRIAHLAGSDSGGRGALDRHAAGIA